MARATTLRALGGLVLALLAGCSGDGQTTGGFTMANAERLPALRPDGPACLLEQLPG